MTVRTIDAYEATVTTATVEIKTLTISGKQLTLSTFRQIPEAELLDEERDGEIGLLGTAWGHVNYWWGDRPKPSGGALHVVWQDGGELRRCVVRRRLGDGWEEAADWYDETYTAACERGVLLSILAGRPFTLPETQQRQYGYPFPIACAGWRAPVQPANVTAIGRLYPEVVYGGASSYVPSENERQKEQNQLLDSVRLLDRWSVLADGAAILAEDQGAGYEQRMAWTSRLAEEAKHLSASVRSSYAQRYDELAALPQLFIAV